VNTQDYYRSFQFHIIDVYIGTNFDDVNAGTEDTFVGSTGGVFQVVGFPGFPFPDGLQSGTTYYWRIDEVNDANAASPWKGDVWSFMVPPRTAYFPDPIDGAEFVDLDATFNWTPGFDAKLHTVYLGDSFEDVDNATGGSQLGTPTYTPASPNRKRFITGASMSSTSPRRTKAISGASQRRAPWAIPSRLTALWTYRY